MTQCGEISESDGRWLAVVIFVMVVILLREEIESEMMMRARQILYVTKICSQPDLLMTDGIVDVLFASSVSTDEG